MKPSSAGLVVLERKKKIIPRYKSSLTSLLYYFSNFAFAFTFSYLKLETIDFLFLQKQNKTKGNKKKRCKISN